MEGARTPMRKVFRISIENRLRASKWERVRAPIKKRFSIGGLLVERVLAAAKK